VKCEQSAHSRPELPLWFYITEGYMIRTSSSNPATWLCVCRSRRGERGGCEWRVGVRGGGEGDWTEQDARPPHCPDRRQPTTATPAMIVFRCL
jgi:hypothetical protein